MNGFETELTNSDIVLNRSYSHPVAPTIPGLYITRKGEVANLWSQGPDGNWFGSVEGCFTFTWWKPTGEHNMFVSDDIVATV